MNLSLERFINQAVSSWMSAEGPDSDIVLSSRIRLARNIKQVNFPTIFSHDEAKRVIDIIKARMEKSTFDTYGDFSLLQMDDLQPLQKGC